MIRKLYRRKEKMRWEIIEKETLEKALITIPIPIDMLLFLILVRLGPL